MTTTAAIAAPPAAKMTLDEYLALEGEHLRDAVWELVDGVLTKMSAPTVEHQILIYLLCRFLNDHLPATGPRPGVALMGVGIALSQFRVPIPDLVYVRAERMSILTARIVNGAPDIVVEVLGSLSQDRAKDLTRNRQWYAAAAIPEYWILDPAHDTLTILQLTAGRYAESAVLTAADTLTTPILPGFALPLTKMSRPGARYALPQPTLT